MLLGALTQAWPPFVLVAALLVIGAVANREGLFDRLGAWLEELPGPPVVLFGAACGLLALITALLNLDTAVVFVMPVVVLAARRRGLPTAAFVYSALFMVNASSLYLPGSNLTNLLVLSGQSIGGTFAARMLTPALVSTAITALGLAVVFRSGLAAAGEPQAPGGAGHLVGPGAAGALVAAVLMVLITNPALPVAGVALIVAGVAVARGEISWRDTVAAASPQVLAGLLVLAVGLGVLARVWHGPEQLLAHAGRVETTGLAAAAVVLLNNLPAAVLLSAHHVPHPRALLIGLNLGPNLAVTGSLAAFLWMRTAAQLEARTSILTLSRIGIGLAPLAMSGALLVSGA